MKEEIEDKMIDDALVARRIRAEVLALHAAKKKEAALLVSAESNVKISAKVVPMWQRSYSIAASIALVLSVGAAAWYFSQKPTEDVVKVQPPVQNIEKPIQNIDNQPVAPIEKEKPIVESKPKVIIKKEIPIEQYSSNNLYAAVDAIFLDEIKAIPNSLKGSGENDDELQFMTARQAIKQQKLQDAIPIFESLIAKNYERKDECKWWLALATLKNNPIQGIKRMESIANENNNLYQNSAKDVLGKLK